jgi:hypothetical protein
MPSGPSQYGFIPGADSSKSLANGSTDLLSKNVIYVAPAQQINTTVEATVGNVTYTAEEFLGGFIIRDPNGAIRTDVTPTAAQLVAKYNGAAVGSGVRVVIRNNSGGVDEVITMAEGTGVTFAALNGTTDDITIAANATHEFMLLFTNVTVGAEAATMYTIGVSTTQA